jgi:hypothetical protein
MVVSSSDELTPEWFTRAFGSPGSTVTDAQIDQVGGGAMCRMVRASLTWDATDGFPESVIGSSRRPMRARSPSPRR